MKNQKKQFAHFKGDKMLARGTIKEIAGMMRVKPKIRIDNPTIRFIQLMEADGGLIYYDEKTIKEEVNKLPEGIPKAYIRHLEYKCNVLEHELRRREVEEC